MGGPPPWVVWFRGRVDGGRPGVGGCAGITESVSPSARGHDGPVRAAAAWYASQVHRYLYREPTASSGVCRLAGCRYSP